MTFGHVVILRRREATHDLDTIGLTLTYNTTEDATATYQGTFTAQVQHMVMLKG
jgi:hypothetical protein